MAQKVKRKGSSFLWHIVHIMIVFDLFNHKGKFKVGDKVRYSWKAYVQIKSALFRDSDHRVLTVSEVCYGGNYVRFEEGGSCDVFWIRKAYWWEK